MINEEEFIKSRPPGSSVVGIADAGNGDETVFLMRENDKRIIELGSPTIEIRSGVIEQGSAYIMPMLVAVGNPMIQENIWESYINYHMQAENGKWRRILELLAKQPRIICSFYGERRSKKIECVNSWAESFQKMLEFLRQTSPWTDEIFVAEKENFYKEYTIYALWESPKI